MAESGAQAGDWAEYSRLVLNELERHEEALEKLTQQLVDLAADVNSKFGKTQTEIALLKLRSGLWGAAAGAIPAVGIVLWWLVTKGG